MKSIVFLYDLYYDFKKNIITIGGIQTYLADLINICTSLGYSVSLYQIGDCEKCVEIDGYQIYQINVAKCDYEAFYKIVVSKIDKDTVVIFGTETIVPRNLLGHKAISIQHGIYWDKPAETKKGGDLRMFISKAIRNYHIIKHVKSLDTLVCVDYNYVNWLRAETDNVSSSLRVIPNYTKIAPIYKKTKEIINIIFARRLFEYRGTRIFADAAEKILKEYSNIHITVAGTGPDEKYMRDKLAAFNNVSFISYKSSESLDIHADKHIAVVPTIGSEGTSLSLLEAMSAQCAVIASNVGGMTNIILDDFNGLMVNAGDSLDLYRAMKRLIDNPTVMNRLSENAYKTVKQAFSYERWAEKWTTVIKSIIE